MRGWFSAPYAERAAQSRAACEVYNSLTDRNSNGGGRRRGSEQGRLDKSSSSQPWANQSTRTLTGPVRRQMVKRSRQIYENNLLGGALLNRAVDNIIGEGMTPQAMSSDTGFNAEVEAAWKEYSPDARGILPMGDWQWQSYLAFKRDGDIGGLLLKGGEVQAIETDYIQSPHWGQDVELKNGQRIIDGVQISASGRPLGYHVVTDGRPGRISTKMYPARNFLFIHDNDRLNAEATRGVPGLAQIGRLLEQMDGTVEAVVVAHRMAAAFGLVFTQENPAAGFGGTTQIQAVNASAGEPNREYQVRPGSVRWGGMGEKVTQVKAEQPTSNFNEFMTFLIRLAGLRFGLPLELALLDFSRTNYSSARASMEQAYRSFRVQQNTYAKRWLTPLYRWRVSKWVNDGTLSGAPADFFNHRWYGQEWPYLDPQKEAAGVMTALDAGVTTLAKELRKRGMDFEEWVEIRRAEIDRMEEAGIPILHSSGTREADGGEAGNENTEQEDPTDGNPPA